MRTVRMVASFVVEDLVSKLRSLGKGEVDVEDMMKITCLEKYHAARLLARLADIGVIEEVKKRSPRKIYRIKQQY